MLLEARVAALEALNVELTATNVELMARVETLLAGSSSWKPGSSRRILGIRRCRRREMGVIVANDARPNVRPASGPRRCWWCDACTGQAARGAWFDIAAPLR